jgi:hypothetical protein
VLSTGSGKKMLAETAWADMRRSIANVPTLAEARPPLCFSEVASAIVFAPETRASEASGVLGAVTRVLSRDWDRRTFGAFLLPCFRWA